MADTPATDTTGSSASVGLLGTFTSWADRETNLVTAGIWNLIGQTADSVSTVSDPAAAAVTNGISNVEAGVGAVTGAVTSVASNYQLILWAVIIGGLLYFFGPLWRSFFK